MTGTADAPAHPTRYPSLNSFYHGEARRLASQERDFGLVWREGNDEALHRAAWICDTGELYLVRLGPVEDGGGEVEVLAVVAAADEIERALEGWREACPQPDSLRWLQQRAAALTQATGRRPAPDPRRSTGNAKLAALLSALIVGMSPAAAGAQDGRGRGAAYPKQSPPPAGTASQAGRPFDRSPTQ